MSIAVLALVALIGCAPYADEQGTAAVMTVSSASFAGGVIPDRYTCKGDGTSPALSWSAGPPGTQSYALIMTDVDAIVGHLWPRPFAHWVIYALPASAHELPEAIPAQQQQLADGTLQGRNGNHDPGYAGPCPGTEPHRYVFTVYALDSKPDLPAGSIERKLRSAMRGHVVGRGQLTASFHK